jgi:seryl-tRNA synthetase
MGAGGVYARTGLFERTVDGLSALISRYRVPGTEVFNFPPVMSRAQLERSGYLKSFPHLLGCVCCLRGEDPDTRATVARLGPGQQWVSAQSATELVLTPAACYPLYPLVAARGRAPGGGLQFDVMCNCFRRESTYEVGRLQSFRMREYVCIGSPEQVVDFRQRWMVRAKEFADLLALPHRIASASDPFSGRAAKFLAVSQLAQELKFELLIPVNSVQNPTPCMSFNYLRDHFGTTWGIETAAGNVAHTSCVGFGMDRLALALFATHGIDIGAWPKRVREAIPL